ncbi:MAG: HTTM domain-containing protein [Myxococcota bacterium]
MSASSAKAGFFERRINVRAIGLLRLLVGLITLVHLGPFLEAAVPGRYFAERFFVPFFEGFPVLSVEGYRRTLLVGVGAALALSAGLFTRAAAALTLPVVSFNVLSNQLHFGHNRAFLMTLLFGLALLPSGAAFSLDGWRQGRRGTLPDETAPAWQLVLVRGLACTPYLASGFSKLVDRDWWGGVVMADRIARYRHVAEGLGVPPALIDPIASHGFNAVMWKIVVLTELFIGVGLWFRRTKLTAMVAALGFHLLIEITSTVSVFSFLGISALLLWVRPAIRERVLHHRPADPSSRRVRAAVARLDWLHRFELRPVEAAELMVEDVDGSRWTGRAARRLVWSRLPLTAPFAAPLRLVDVLRRRLWR